MNRGSFANAARWARRVYRLAKRITASQSDAEKAVQV
jgi:hypothetical protein